MKRLNKLNKQAISSGNGSSELIHQLKKDGECTCKILKKNSRVTTILFCGRGYNFVFYPIEVPGRDLVDLVRGAVISWSHGLWVRALARDIALCS